MLPRKYTDFDPKDKLNKSMNFEDQLNNPL